MRKNYDFSKGQRGKYVRRQSPRPVDPVNNWQDRWCLLLAMRGRSNRAIIKRTRLTPGQISYRLKKYDVSRMEFRNGEGRFAEIVDKSLKNIAHESLMQHLQRHVRKG